MFVSYRREAHKIDNAYVDPVVEDINAVPVTSVTVHGRAFPTGRGAMSYQENYRN